MKGRGNPHSPFAVQMRAFERQLLRDALVFNGGSVVETGKMLGMTGEFIRVRAHDLGGVWDDDPPNEPYVLKKDRKKDEERSHKHSTVGGHSVDQGEPTDEREREAVRADALEDGDEGQSDQL